MTGRHRRSPVTLADGRKHRAEITEIAQRHGVQNIRVLGSVARGESDQNSDLDLLVDVLSGRGLLAVSAFAGAVEERLRVATQVATVIGLKPRIREPVIAEAVPI